LGRIRKAIVETKRKGASVEDAVMEELRLRLREAVSAVGKAKKADTKVAEILREYKTKSFLLESELDIEPMLPSIKVLREVRGSGGFIVLPASQAIAFVLKTDITMTSVDDILQTYKQFKDILQEAQEQLQQQQQQQQQK
jgi:hypothetical protein